MSLSWPFKDPNEVLDYDIDWTNRLYSEAELLQVAGGATVVPADTIVTSTFTLPAQTGSSQLVANSTANTTTSTKIWLSGGVEGSNYDILNRVVTAGGRTMDQTTRLKIKSK